MGLILSASLAVSAQSYTQVGDIKYNPALDDAAFFLCDDIETNQYSQLSSNYEFDEEFFIKHFSAPPFYMNPGFLAISL